MIVKRRKEETAENGMTLVDHLAELRQRIMITMGTLVVTFVIGFYYSPAIVEYFMEIPGELVYLHPGEAFFVHLKVALVVAIIVSSPVILFQVIRFIVPGLLAKEIRVLYIGLPFALGMFALGVVFAYQVIVPLAYRFFMGFGTQTLQPLISIESYVSFVLGLLLPFGAVFQLPLVVLLLTSVGILHPETLTRYRKYTVLVIFILAALLTPPDVVSQTLMAIPMLLLYEFSIILSRIVFRRKLAKTK